MGENASGPNPPTALLLACDDIAPPNQTVEIDEVERGMPTQLLTEQQIFEMASLANINRKTRREPCLNINREHDQRPFCEWKWPVRAHALSSPLPQL